MRRKMMYISLVALLFLGSVYNTGLRLVSTGAVPDTHAHYKLSLQQHWKSKSELVEKFKLKLKVRYRASEVKLDLCGTGSIDFAKRAFRSRQVFFDNYSFHTLSYQHDIKLRGPPAGLSC